MFGGCFRGVYSCHRNTALDSKPPSNWPRKCRGGGSLFRRFASEGRWNDHFLTRRESQFLTHRTAIKPSDGCKTPPVNSPPKPHGLLTREMTFDLNNDAYFTFIIPLFHTHFITCRCRWVQTPVGVEVLLLRRVGQVSFLVQLILNKLLNDFIRWEVFAYA